MDGAETGDEQDVGKGSSVKPTLRKVREGWGTHSVGLGKFVKKERVGHPPKYAKDGAPTVLA